MKDHAEFQQAVHHTSQHLDLLEPLRLRLLALVEHEGGYYLVPTKPLVRPLQYRPLVDVDAVVPEGWEKPETAWGVLKDAAGGGPCLTQGGEGELWLAALSICRSEYAHDYHSARVLVQQVGVLIAAKVGVKVQSFDELPDIDSAAKAEVLADVAARGLLAPNGEERAWMDSVGVLADQLVADGSAPDLAAFTDNNPQRRRTPR